MNIIQCKICNKPFQSTGGKMCGSCLRDVDDAFVVIRDYLYDNPGNISVKKLSEKVEIPENIILHLIREGRIVLEAGGGPGAPLLCELCRRPIKEGTMCADCRSKLASTLNSTLPKEPAQSQSSGGAKPERGGTSRMHSGPGKR